MPKQERLHSRKLIELLFSGTGSHSMAAYPLRMVWMETERQAGDAQVQMMVSVSKRHFKHAVNRNRVKRQVREAFRRQKHLLTEKVPPTQTVAIAFIWLTDRLLPSADIESRMKNVLERIGKRVES